MNTISTRTAVRPPETYTCPNCGQTILAAFGQPFLCDFCQQPVTWKQSNVNKALTTSQPINAKSTQRPVAAQQPAISLIQKNAESLYHELGLNVFPMPLGQKFGYDWKFMQAGRLHPAWLREVFAGECNIVALTGRTSGGLFIFDCEDEPTFQRHAAAMRQRNIPLWCVQTSRGYHIYLKSSAGQVKSIGTKKLGTYEVRGGGKDIVLCPPSVHPSGAIYRWHMQEDSDAGIPVLDPARIDWLRDSTGQPVTLTVARSGGLNAATLDYLKSGAQIPPDTHRHIALRDAGCEYAGCGYSRQDAERDLAPIARRSGLPDDEIASTLDWCYQKSRSPARTYRGGKASTVSAYWQRALAYSASRLWTGRNGASQRSVFAALVERARVDSDDTGAFRGSVRELMTLAHVGQHTVERALAEFVAGGLLLRCDKDETSGAARWQFGALVLNGGRGEMATLVNAFSPTSYSVATTTLPASENSVANERNALAPTAHHVYHVLLSMRAPAMPKVIAAAANVTRDQCKRALDKLSDYGLVTQEHKRAPYTAIPRTDAELARLWPNAVRRANRRADKVAAQQQRHRSELMLAARHSTPDASRTWKCPTGKRAEEGKTKVAQFIDSKRGYVLEMVTTRTGDLALIVNGEPFANKRQTRRKAELVILWLAETFGWTFSHHNSWAALQSTLAANDYQLLPAFAEQQGSKASASLHSYYILAPAPALAVTDWPVRATSDARRAGDDHED